MPTRPHILVPLIVTALASLLMVFGAGTIFIFVIFAMRGEVPAAILTLLLLGTSMATAACTYTIGVWQEVRGRPTPDWVAWLNVSAMWSLATGIGAGIFHVGLVERNPFCCVMGLAPFAAYGAWLWAKRRDRLEASDSEDDDDEDVDEPLHPIEPLE